MSAPRFEIVQTAAGWHSRYVAGNSRIVWSTEVYKKRGGAIKAINVLAGIVGAPQHISSAHGRTVRDVGHGLEIEWLRGALLEVRQVDERA